MVRKLKSFSIPYSQTGRFSKIVLDYLSGKSELKEFYSHAPDTKGIKEAIAARQQTDINRQLLVSELSAQYAGIAHAEAVQKNISLLSQDNTFTVCTAHQPNLFTGHLYFVYKILHAIKLAEELSKQLPEFKFVPVFFMGSEDADLDELNHIFLEGKKYEWPTKQTGAVGRMIVDKELLRLIDSIEGRLLVEPHGIELITLLKECYKEGSSIENATFLFVHRLFQQFGLIVLLPDNGAFKKEMLSIFEDDLLNHTPREIVNNTSGRLSELYHAQAFARDINLFYMREDLRNRIVRNGDTFVVHETDLTFTKDQLLQELRSHPERFSPNVILRGLFQEKILPNLAFVGGGGELAYWLQLKDLFDHYKVPFPALVLRNSLLIIEERWNELRKKLGLPIDKIFEDHDKIIKDLLLSESANNLSVADQKIAFENIYKELSEKAAAIDTTLLQHIAALEARHLKRIEKLEKKFISAEKKNQSATDRQLQKLLDSLFPGGGLQERQENFMLFYAKWGLELFDEIYEASPTLSPSFTVLVENEDAGRVEL